MCVLLYLYLCEDIVAGPHFFKEVFEGLVLALGVWLELG